MKKVLSFVAILSVLFFCGCEKQEQNQNKGSEEKKDAVATLVCTKTIEEDGEKETDTFEITSKNNIVKKVTNSSTAEVDASMIDLMISLSESMVKAYNEVDGMEASVTKEGSNAFKVSITVDYDAFNVEQAKEKLGDDFDGEDFAEEKNMTVDEFVKKNAEGYECK